VGVLEEIFYIILVNCLRRWTFGGGPPTAQPESRGVFGGGPGVFGEMFGGRNPKEFLFYVKIDLAIFNYNV
jgi:hypothetical protein